MLWRKAGCPPKSTTLSPLVAVSRTRSPLPLLKCPDLLLVLLALFFAWLGYLAWPRLSSAERAMRCVVVAVLLGLGVLQSGIF